MTYLLTRKLHLALFEELFILTVDCPTALEHGSWECKESFWWASCASNARFKHNDQRRTKCASNYENVDGNKVYKCDDGQLNGAAACTPSK